MPKKKFIDRKKAVTFHLVHRSQQDPLAADESAPQRVLVPKKKAKPDKRLEEQHKYGIYFDDDYNYLQHLRDSGSMDWERVEYKPKENSKLNLPSSVFASKVEEDVGLLNKAAPESGLRLDLDPDLVAAMDDDFDFSDPENELEDNFIQMANADCSDDEEDCSSNCNEDCSSDLGSEQQDKVLSLNASQHSFKDVETKSRFTEYSMSSSVIRRNAQLTLLDRRFEVIYASYDDSEIGALDGEEIKGCISDSELLLRLAEEFQRETTRQRLDDNKEKIPYIERSDSDSSDEYEYTVVEEKPKWDCQSILSRNTNTHNHPKIIEEPKKEKKIKVNMKTGMPTNVLKNKLTAKSLAAFNDENLLHQRGPRSDCGESVSSRLSALSIRPKDETREDKRKRKQGVKEYKRERRAEKKASKLAFKEDLKLEAKIEINKRNNVQGNKFLYKTS